MTTLSNHPLKRNVRSWGAGLITNKSLVRSIALGFASGLLSAVLGMIDRSLEGDFLSETLPDTVVFSVFITFCSLVTGFRTAHALNRYTMAAGLIYKLKACWFDSCSTLVSFARVSEATEEQVSNVQNTLVRLMSLCSALAYDDLQTRGSQNVGHSFELLRPDDLDESTIEAIVSAPHKTEFVFQMIQSLIVDSVRSKVFSIAPPILTRSFQDLAQGLQTYYEAKQLAFVPLPRAYALVTVLTVGSMAAYVPVALAFYTKGPLSAFVFSSCGVFLTSYLNYVANTLENPFTKEAQTLDTAMMQRQLNATLLQLVGQSTLPSPKVSESVRPSSMEPMGAPQVQRTWSEMRRKETSRNCTTYFEAPLSDCVLKAKSMFTGNPSDSNLSEPGPRKSNLDCGRRRITEVDNQSETENLFLDSATTCPVSDAPDKAETEVAKTCPSFLGQKSSGVHLEDEKLVCAGKCNNPGHDTLEELISGDVPSCVPYQRVQADRLGELDVGPHFRDEPKSHGSKLSPNRDVSSCEHLSEPSTVMASTWPNESFITDSPEMQGKPSSFALRIASHDDESVPHRALSCLKFNEKMAESANRKPKASAFCTSPRG